MKKFKNKINNDLIDFYKEENLIYFNNYKSYFESENILNKGKYYLQNPLEKGINNALSIKDKKFVAIKELNLIDEKEFINEINLLKEMNECENIAKYLDSFEENNTKFIVTELFSCNLRNLINEKENGFSINEIKKIFC
jgi:serine/threonine protein kinase